VKIERGVTRREAGATGRGDRLLIRERKESRHKQGVSNVETNGPQHIVGDDTFFRLERERRCVHHQHRQPCAVHLGHRPVHEQTSDCWQLLWVSEGGAIRAWWPSMDDELEYIKGERTGAKAEAGNQRDPTTEIFAKFSNAKNSHAENFAKFSTPFI
jgi:hypothetical protein